MIAYRSPNNNQVHIVADEDEALMLFFALNSPNNTIRETNIGAYGGGQGIREFFEGRDFYPLWDVLNNFLWERISVFEGEEDEDGEEDDPR